ncbi:preprotein translocase subunit SecY [Candidatus Bathyarchaeota archaeon]|nr:preprotein translocase subunit SecY [Candidatus Bathyarchaeota archaeon]MBS7618985.1 preprotein translocase subunit SecY [Candidatus Bathyarchaeota archaeon]
MFEVKKPEKKVSFISKLLWTFFALLIYYVMSETPIYGISYRGLYDPLIAARVIFASTHGTLMELGIGPIVTGGLILQLLVGSGIVECDLSNPEDRALYTTANRFMSILMTIFQAIVYILGGVYGMLSIEASILVFIQLLAAGVIVILLDEMVQKWGLGSGISLFILAGVAKQIWWFGFSPLPGIANDGKLFGALPAFIEGLVKGEDVVKAFMRSGAENTPNMVGFISTVVTFLVIIYLEGVRIEIPISYARFRGFRARFPIKLLYVSVIPVIFTSALLANFFVGLRFIWARFNPSNQDFWLNIMAQFNPETMEPMKDCIAYYLSSPRSLSVAVEDPVRTIVYIALFVSLCVVFSIMWIEVGGMGPKNVAEQLIDAGVQIPGRRRTVKSIESIIGKYVPIVAVLGGALIGLIAVVSDLFNVFGSGTGVLLSVDIAYQYYQLLVQERVVDMYPALRPILEK